jgi:sugar phosphate isomerase/epimerase
MMKSSVTISLVPEARGGPFVFWDDHSAACRFARQLGLDAVEVFGPPDVDAAALRRSLDNNGLKMAAMGTGVGWVKHRLTLTSPDAEVRKKAIGFIESVIDLAASFGAPAIIGSMQGRHGDSVDKATATAYLIEGLYALSSRASTYNLPLLFEPLNRYETNMVNTVEDGVHLVRRLGTNNVKLLADLFHMNIEETDVPAAIRAGGDAIGHIHFVDTNRRPAGCGHMEFASIAAALRDIQYNGYLSAEALPYPDPFAAASQTIQTYRKFFASK